MVGAELPGAVRLRPLEDADLPIFEDDYSSRDGSGEYQWFGFGRPGRGLAEMGALDRTGGRLTAVVADRVIGSVFWFRKEYGPSETSWCWELALHVRKDERGRGFGTQVTRLISSYLFDTHGLIAYRRSPTRRISPCKPSSRSAGTPARGPCDLSNGVRLHGMTTACIRYYVPMTITDGMR